MVARYIAKDINEELARREIIKTSPAAVSFPTIYYQHQFDRIPVGQYYLPVTQFLPSYHMTYCTSCWKVGHMRGKCKSHVCCRKCLMLYVNGLKHTCLMDDIKCVQCGENHLLLSSTCPVIKQYRDEFKVAVDNALASGLIKRKSPGEASRPFQVQDDDFPTLIHAHAQGQGEARRFWQASIPQVPQADQSNLIREVNVLSAAINALSDTMTRVEKNLNSLNTCIESQDKRAMLYNNSINAIIDTCFTLSNWVQASNSERTKLKKNINM
ncbi:unnamed protein product [Rotaria sp. Silwood2]|nr:unnamed protein product [Rotaria sp. Silwood2]CAF2901160.1 unnamed protein product [Rotaria sp. Silwood2]CAF4371960.1 unnamed protein product [Rotaria sp. Silwood2]